MCPSTAERGEEMLHFTIVANVLNALGGRPLIDDKAAVPIYPAILPMGVAGGEPVALKQMCQHVAVVGVCAGDQGVQREPVAVTQHVILAAGFPSVGW